MSDNINHPAHYTAGKVECIDALEAATKGLTGIEAVCTANAIKYLWRWSRKGGVEDLRKAQWYIDRLIKKLGGIIMKTLQCGFVPDPHGKERCCIDGKFIPGYWITGEDLSKSGILKDTMYEIVSNNIFDE